VDLIHQLTPMLKSLRLGGVLETLEVRNRTAIDAKLSYVEFLSQLLGDEVERRMSALAAKGREAARAGWRRTSACGSLRWFGPCPCWAQPSQAGCEQEVPRH